MRTIEIDRLLQPTIEALDKTTESKDSHRQFLTVIWWDAESKVLVSTNGRSMLVCRYANLKNKFGETSGAFRYTKPYLIEDEKYLENHSFPTWQRVLPEYSSSMRDEIRKPAKGKGILKVNGSGIATKYKPFFMMESVALITGKMFNPELFDMVAKISDAFVNVYHREGLDPVVLTDQDDKLQYVVMPMQQQA